MSSSSGAAGTAPSSSHKIRSKVNKSGSSMSAKQPMKPEDITTSPDVNMSKESISSKPGEKKPSVQDKLEEINNRLALVRRKIAGRKFESQKSISTAISSKKNSQTTSSYKKMHHPNLEYIFGEVVYSPYMTKPLDPYPKETFLIPEKLRELRQSGSKLKELPKDQQPFDVEAVKTRFIEEVVNYKDNFSHAVRIPPLPYLFVTKIIKLMIFIRRRQTLMLWVVNRRP